MRDTTTICKATNLLGPFVRWCSNAQNHACRSRCGWYCILVMWFVLDGMLGRVTAQIQDDQVVNQDVPRVGQELRFQVEPPLNRPNASQIRSSLYRAAFSGLTTAESVERFSETLILSTIESLEQATPISNEQKRSFVLALRGQQLNFLKKLERVEASLVSVHGDQARYQKLYMESVQELSEAFSRLIYHDRASFFEKLLKKTLHPEQLRSYKEFQRIEKGKVEYRYLKTGFQFLSELFGLSLKQQRELWTLIIQETQPPDHGPMTYYPTTSINLLNQISEEHLKSVLKSYQWKMFDQYSKMYGGRNAPPAQPANHAEAQASGSTAAEVGWSLPADMQEADRSYGVRRSPIVTTP